jgi:glyoxylase-like metal-dependent hydrolase (beta-lactamase superfamily II)
MLSGEGPAFHANGRGVSIPLELQRPTTIGEGIVQIRLPMAGNPMRYVNGYVVEDEGGPTLIDCGWKGDDVLSALEEGLARCGYAVRDLRRLLVTHFHMDHYGLAGTLLAAGVPELGMHPRDWQIVKIRAAEGDDDAIVDSWLARNGLPLEPADDDPDYERYDVAKPTRLIEDGERIGRLRALWTPGHSPGHLCFVDTVSGRTFTGDHVLDPGTPHVGLWLDRGRDPMGEYVASLRAVGAVETSGVLPAHGEAFPDLARRVEELLEHEAARERDVLHALNAGPSSATTVAGALRWRRRGDRFDQLPNGYQQFAVAETLAHLEHLRARGLVTRDERTAPITWALAAPSATAAQ